MPITLNNNLKTLKIGDYFWCKYTAPTTGQVGTFSDIATKTDAEATPVIPVASSATPTGYFKYIVVDFDHLGRVMLIADRNIQHSISWDTLNTSGIASGSGLPTLFDKPNNFLFTTRLLTGGTVSTDKDNEWDNYIVSSTLGGNITSGDNAVWNWSGIYSWTSTVVSGTPANRVYRGSISSAYFANTVSTNSGATLGFRPVLLIEILAQNKTLILQNGEYKKWDVVGTKSKLVDSIPFVMTSNSENGITVSASAEVASTGQAFRALDKKDDTLWTTSSSSPLASPQHLTVNFGTPRKIVQVTLNKLMDTIGDFDIQYSSDNITFTNAMSSSLSVTEVKINKVFAINVTGKYQYWRLNIKTNGSSGNPHGLASMSFIEEVEENIYGWKLASTTLPTSTQFIDNGMDSLVSLLRKVQSLEPQVMDSKIGILPVESTNKVFSKILDLNKYIDVRKIEVK